MPDKADAKTPPKEGNRSKWWVIPAITAAALAAIFAIAYLAYVPPRREYLANRNFRALAVFGDQVQQMVSIHGSILESAADLAEPGRDPKRRYKEDLNQFLVLRPEDRNLKKEEQEQETRKDYLKFLAPDFELTEIPAGHTNPQIKQPRLEVKRRNGNWELVMTAERHPKSRRDYVGRLNLNTVLTPLSTNLPFDDLLLVSEQGTVVYQRERSGPQFTTLASLLQAQSGPDAKAAAAPSEKSDTAEVDASKVSENSDARWKNRSMHLTEVTLAGTLYKLFLQPVLVDVYSDEPGKSEAPREWVLCGLKSAQSLEWEALSISSTLVIWATSLFLVICLSGPVLKIFLMNRRERLRFSELGVLAVFLVLLTSVITLATLQTVGVPLNDDTDNQLELLGKTLSTNIHDELRAMREQLVSYCGLAHDDLQLAWDREVIRKSPEAMDEMTGKRVEAIPTPTAYPYLSNVFWTDDDGQQIVKWSASGYLTPLIDVSHQDLYNHPKSVYLDGKGPPFYFGSVVPPNKLEYVSVLIMRTEDCLPKEQMSDLKEDVSGGSVALTAQPLSLIDPILPYGFGFALVDETGKVVFHGNKTRNLHENFFQETDWNRKIYAAAFGHGETRSVPVKYMGEDYQARIVPIVGLSQAPWSLVVYRDLTMIRTVNLEAMTMATTLLLAIIGLPLLIAGVWCWSQRMRFAPEWLWPNAARSATYVSVITVQTVLIFVFLAAGFTGTVEANIAACVVMPYTALLLTIWCFRAHSTPTMHSGFRKASKNHRTVLAAPTLVAIIAALIFFSAGRIGLRAFSGWPVLVGFAFLGAMPMLERPGRYLVLRRARSLQMLGRTAPKTESSNEPERYSWRKYYLASIILPLLLIGVLTPMALFRACINVERRLALKQSELHLAKALNERLLMNESGCWISKQIGQFACDAFKTRSEEAWRRIVLDPLLEGGNLRAVSHSRVATGGDSYSGWLQTIVVWMHHDFNATSAEMSAMLSDRRPKTGAEEPDWHWDNDESGGRSVMTLLWHGVHFASDNDADHENDLKISAVIPRLSPLNIFTGASVAVFVILIMSIIVWAIVRKVFLFQIAPLRITGERQALEAIRDRRNLAVLLPPCCDWKLDEPKFTIDIPTLMTSPNWAEQMDLSALPFHTLIELANFEHSTGIAEIDGQKAVLLNRLLSRPDTQIAVMLTVPVSAEDYRKMFPELEVIDLREEPFYWLKQYEGPARDLIWKECCPLPALWPLGAQLAQELRHADSCSPETIAAEMLERADPYYKLVWKECTEDQKFVLVQLAEDGLLNPTNLRSIRQLIRRGLITTTPQFRLMNESFRRFLRSVSTAELRRHWKHESRQSGWGKMHGAFSLTMVLLGVFLITTQNALWQSSAAYVTTLLGALGTASRVFNVFRTGTVVEKAD